MARKMVLLALVFIAIVGYVCANEPDTQTPAENAAANAVPEAAASPVDDDIIGATDEPGDDDNDSAVEAPLGAPVTPDAFAPTSVDAMSPKAGGSDPAVKVSVLAGVMTVAGFFF